MNGRVAADRDLVIEPIEPPGQWRVVGGRVEYTIVEYGDGLACSCAGFGFRRRCRHVRELRRRLDAAALCGEP